MSWVIKDKKDNYYVGSCTWAICTWTDQEGRFEFDAREEAQAFVEMIRKIEPASSPVLVKVKS